MSYMMFVWPIVAAFAICLLAGAYAVLRRSTGVGQVASLVWLLGSMALLIYSLVRLHGEVPTFFVRVGLGMVFMALLAIGFLGALIVSTVDAWLRRSEK